jgi:hypothetical protein
MIEGRLRLVGVAVLVGAAGFGVLRPGVGVADERPDRDAAPRVASVWLASDSKVDGWRYVTRYEVGVTGNRLVAVGALYVVAPNGLTQQRPPTVSEFSGTIDGGTLTGEVSIYRPTSEETRAEVTRSLEGTVDLERGEIVLRYQGPAPDAIVATAVEEWDEAPRTMTLRRIGQRPQ